MNLPIYKKQYLTGSKNMRKPMHSTEISLRRADVWSHYYFEHNCASIYDNDNICKKIQNRKAGTATRSAFGLATGQSQYTGCIKKKVIQLWSALARLLCNRQKSFFHSRKEQAFSFRMSLFLWNLKKNWVNMNQKEIAGRNRIFPPLNIIMAANENRKFH